MKLRGCMFLFLLSVPLYGVAAASGTFQGVKTSVDAQGTTFLLQLSGPVKYSPTQAGPKLYLVDLTGVSAQTAADNQPVQSPLVSSYRLFSYHGADNQPHVGMEITLKAEADVQTKQVTGGLQIRVQPLAGHGSSPAPSAASAASASPSGPAPREGNAAPEASSLLKEVSVVQPGDGNGLNVEIAGDGEMTYQAYRLSNPDRLVLDLSNTLDHVRQNRVTVENALLHSVRVAQFSNQPPVSRVVLDLDHPVSYQVLRQGNGLVVSLSSKTPDEAPKTGRNQTKAQTDGNGISKTAAVGSQANPAHSPANPSLSLNSNTVPPQTASARAPQPATTPQPVLLASNDTTGENLFAPLSGIAPIENTLPPAPLASESQPEPKPQIQPASSASPAPPATAPAAVSTPASAPVANASSTPAAEQPELTASLQTPDTSSPVLRRADQSPALKSPTETANSSVGAVDGNQQPPAAEKSALLAQRGPVATPAVLRSQGPQESVKCIDGSYTGEPVSLNLKDVDVKDFFRLMHEVSGLNVVLDPNVSGSVTIVLDQVPWDQAMDIVDKNNALDCARMGNVIRIAKVSTLEAEAKAQLAKAQAEEQAEKEGEPLQTLTRTLSYATAQALIKPLTVFLSPRGSVTVDPRTNMVIVKDIPATLETINGLLDKMDRRTQQVEIEARIVSATRSFARDIGNQIAELGTSGNVSLGGTSETGTSPTPVSQPLSVNLPATAPTSGISMLISAGSKFALDDIITAAESKSIGKLLSRPKIITQNNIEATVQQGVEIPIQTNINNTITTQYINAVLRLTVTPQITAEGTIFLKINIENTNIDSGIPPIDGMPALDTQSATTNVLVTDGGTVFFGGIMQTNNQINVTQVPLLGDIPLLGNLFKEKSTSSSTTELLFFITPKITQS